MIPIAAREISSILSKAAIDFEMVFVDDGSKDGTWRAIESTASSLEQQMRGIRFSRNFGKEAAIYAGLCAAVGDCCVVIDCDLQHPPRKIVEMYRLWENGCEIVEGIKVDRGDESGAHRLLAQCFYQIISKLTSMDMANSSDFKLIDRKIVDIIKGLPEHSMFFRAISYWVGFKKCEITYTVEERKYGESKWDSRALMRYALKNITAFSAAPMQIVTILGFVALIVAVVFSVISLAQWTAGTAIGGFTTVILLTLLMSSLIMISLGLVGYYIARIYEEVQGRPRFIISESTSSIEPR